MKLSRHLLSPSVAFTLVVTLLLAHPVLVVRECRQSFLSPWNAIRAPSLVVSRIVGREEDAGQSNELGNIMLQLVFSQLVFDCIVLAVHHHEKFQFGTDVL